jgi:hypothetical protein
MLAACRLLHRASPNLLLKKNQRAVLRISDRLWQTTPADPVPQGAVRQSQRPARKGSRALASIWLRAMNEKITINENGQRRRITRQQAAVKQLANKAAPVTNAPSRTCSDFRRCCFPTHR